MGLSKEFLEKVAGRQQGRRLKKAPAKLPDYIARPFQGPLRTGLIYQELVKSDYRYWMLVFGNPMGRTVCRMCGRGEFTTASREVHLKAGCRDKLDAIYKFLKEKKLCSICCAACKKGKWGVILCPGVCRNRWIYQVVGAGFNTAALFVKEHVDSTVN